MRVLERKNLAKFGEAKLNEENVTLISPDFIKIEHPDDIANEQEDDVTGTLQSFILKQQERAIERDNDYDRDRDFVRKTNVDEDDRPGGKSGNAYVPPSQRLGALPSKGGGLENAFGGSKGGADDSNTESTIKVSNLTKSVTEDDIRELFGHFGGIYRVSLPKLERKEADGRIIKEPKGFAYVAFYMKKDAEVAMDKLQGHGYDHLILKLEWAKPQKEGGGGGSGNVEQYRSGYGQKLAQDTTERVSYASNLTGNAR